MAAASAVAASVVVVPLRLLKSTEILKGSSHGRNIAPGPGSERSHLLAQHSSRPAVQLQRASGEGL